LNIGISNALPHLQFKWNQNKLNKAYKKYRSEKKEAFLKEHDMENKSWG